MAQDTAVTIIQRVSAEVGIPVSAAPFSSTDTNQSLLIQLLNGAGLELANFYEWPSLDKKWTIDTTIDGTSGTYPLPADFGWAHSGTFWNETQSRPIGGPLTPTEWAAARSSWAVGAGPLTEVCRQFGSNLEMLPVPLAASTTLSVEYSSTSWVRRAAGTLVALVTLADDTVLIDSIVVSRLVKLRFLEAKGMNTTTALPEFQTALSDAMYRPLGAPTLSLNGHRANPFPNIPESGFGY
jgi:hypothetical protein